MHILENIMPWICGLILVFMTLVALGSTFCTTSVDDDVRFLSDAELLARYRFLKDEVGADLSSSEFTDVLNEIRRRELTVDN